MTDHGPTEAHPRTIRHLTCGGKAAYARATPLRDDLTYQSLVKLDGSPFAFGEPFVCGTCGQPVNQCRWMVEP